MDRTMDGETGALFWGCGIPTAPQGAELNFGRPGAGFGFIDELA